MQSKGILQAEAMALTASQEPKRGCLAAVSLFHRAGTSWSQQVFSTEAKDFRQCKRNLCKQVETEVPVKKEVPQAWRNKTPPSSLTAVRLQSHYVLLHLFLWQASASEPQELSESLPDEEEEEEGFEVL